MSDIALRFGRSAAEYDQAASLQRDVARELDRRIAAIAVPAKPRILDVGCGTGFLSSLLKPRLAPRLLCLADIAAPMAAAAYASLADGETAVAAVAMDGALPAFADASFDLVCGSMSFQWFADPAAAIGQLCRLVAPGGALAFASLAGDNFPEWRQALTALDLPIGAHSYPQPEDWLGFMPPGASIAAEQRTQHHASAHDFLESLGRIGADTPAEGYRPLSPGELRRVLRRHATGMDVTYGIVYGVYLRHHSV